MQKRYFALIYYVAPDFAEKRGPYREPHLRKVFDANRRGELVHGGALGDPPERALLVFRTENPSPVERFAETDPYVTSGLVERWEVQPWTIVCGLRAGDQDPLSGHPDLEALR